MGQIYNISANLSFLDSLAHGIKSRFPDYSEVTILLPTKRAIPQLRKLLGDGPRIEALGELEEAQPANAISKLARIMQISKIIRKNRRNLDIAQSTRLAKSLISLIDELQAKKLPFSALQSIVPIEFSEHWQLTYNFLNEILDEWQEFLKAHKLVEPIEARNAEFLKKINNIQSSAAGKPYIIAGSTGTVQMTLELIKTVYKSDNGVIVLQGLDKNLTEENFKNLLETHAQFLLSRLLKFLNVSPYSVDEWEVCKQTARQELISTALFPSDRTSEWKDFNGNSTGLSLLECRNIEEESSAICQILLEAKEKQKTAMIVTSNNSLKKQIKSKLKLWGIEVNDSSAQSFLSLTEVNFLIRLAEFGADKLSPIKFLSFFKHWLVPLEIKQKIRQIEIDFLRGIRNESFDILQHIEINGMADFLKSFEAKEISLSNIIEKHLVIAINIAGEGAFEGIIEFIAELKTLAKNFGNIDPLSYPQLLKAIFSNEARMPETPRDAKINIFSRIEARLQTADICILAGMNEGDMPALPDPDLFLNQQMRRSLGLDLPEKKIGQQAHDFEMLSQIPIVFYTRSLKDGGAPSTASRFIESLTTVTQINKAITYIEKARKLITPDSIKPCKRPQPKPPLEARPKKFSATKINKLMRDPYWVYANEILKLKKMEDIDSPITSREFGNFVHAALHKFNQNYNGELQTLIKCGEEVLIGMGNIKEFKKFWWPRFLRISDQLINMEITRRENLIEVKSETSGATDFGGFQVYARADRIEISADTINVIDYKTGATPSQKNIHLGIESQLAVEGIIFSEKFGKPVNLFEYWSIKGRMNDELKVESREINLQNVKAKISELLEEFSCEETAFSAKPRPNYALGYNDYEHLARNQEWEQ